MRNVAFWHCKSDGNVKKYSRTRLHTSFSVFQNLRERLCSPSGLSATRRELLLSDCLLFASMEEKARGEMPAASRGHFCAYPGQLANHNEQRCGGDRNKKRSFFLCRSVRRLAEFIASTGSCDSLLAPLQCGYVELTPTDGLRRAEHVLRCTERALSFSNGWMVDIVAPLFGCCSENKEAVVVSTFREEKGLYVDSTNEVAKVTITDHTKMGNRAPSPPLLRDGGSMYNNTIATATNNNDNNNNNDDGNDVFVAPFTSHEVVGLLQWCTWHMRTALNGVQQNLPQSMNCVPLVITLLTQFLVVLLDNGMRSGAIESLAHELALSDMAFMVTGHVLEVLCSALPFCSVDCLFSPSPATDGCSSSNGRDCDRGSKRYDGWRIQVETQRAFLCSQRERWERALSLLLRTQLWNEGLDKKVGASSPTLKTGKEKKEEKTFFTDVLRTLAATPRSVFCVLQYILAEHGQWKLCKELWGETVRRRHFCAVPFSAVLSSSLSPTEAQQFFSGVDNIIVALAFVNAKPPLLSTAVTAVKQTKGFNHDFQANFLRTLLYLGVVPHRVPSAAEFATFIRHSFNLFLGRGHIKEFLMPSVVWRLTKAYPRQVRVSLCLLCFQVVLKSGLTRMLELEDLYVVTSLLRQFFETWFYSFSCTKTTSMVGGSGQVGEVFFFDFDEDKTIKTTGANERRKERNGYDKKDFDTLRCLLMEFAAATRRPVTATEDQLLAIAEIYLIHHQQILPAERKTEGDVDRYHSNGRTVFASINGDNREYKSKSTVMLSLVSRDLMALVTMMPHGIDLGVTWQAVLCAISSEAQRYSLSSHFLRAVETVAQTVAKKAVEPGNAFLLEPLVRLAPLLSSFTVSKIVQGPVGRLLSWSHCLQLFLCTPWTSNVQLYLLRRGMQGWTARGLTTNVQSFVQAITLPPRLLPAIHTRATDMQVLKIFAERNWCRALEVYAHSGPRVQWACAPHVMRLLIFADVWRFPHGSDLHALLPVLRVAVRTVDGERVAEDVLYRTLQRGQWATGLAFHQFLQEDQSDMLRANLKIKMYGTLLCKGLMSQSAMTRTIAEVVKSARGADWVAASRAFIRYVTAEGKSSEGNSQSPLPDGVVPSSNSPRNWLALFNSTLSSELSHLAHTVRYSMLLCPGRWEQALQWFSPHVLPLPLHHRFLLQRLTGLLADPVLDGEVREARTNVLVRNTDAISARGELAASEKNIKYSHSQLSMSLVQVALQEKLHCTRTLATIASVETVHHALRVLQRHGQWEQSMAVCEHAFANRCFPHSAGACVLASCASLWEASIACFAHLTARMRPDAATAVLALKACVQGQQWVLAFRILRQSLLTSATPAPRVVHYAIRAALDCGVWSAALRLARQYQCTSSPLLANTIMQTYVHAKCWNDAVGHFYGCVTRGMCPLDESLSLAITASQMVSAEYRDIAGVVGVIASALEDFCHVDGVVLEHVLVVCREMTGWPMISLDPNFIFISLAYRSTPASGSARESAATNIC